MPGHLTLLAVGILFIKQKTQHSRSGFCVPIDTILIPLFGGIKKLVEAAGVEPASDDSPHRLLHT